MGWNRDPLPISRLLSEHGMIVVLLLLCAFFGVVTRFHLRVYPRPKTIGSVLQVYDME